MPPKTTTVRVNLLQTTRQSIRKLIEPLLTDSAGRLIDHSLLFDVLSFTGNTNSELLLLLPSNEATGEVMVDIRCAAALLRGAHIFAAGVLSMAGAAASNDLVNIFADVEGTCKKGAKVPHASALKVFIGCGRIRMDRSQLFGVNLNPRYILKINIFNILILNAFF